MCVFDIYTTHNNLFGRIVYLSRGYSVVTGEIKR